MPRILARCALLLFFCIPAAHAQWIELYWADPALRWRTLQTEHFEIHFAEQSRAEARRVAAVAERIYPRTTRLLDWEPRRRTQIVLFNSGDFANGFASPVPYNFSGIFLSPPDQGELLQDREWLELVISHEFFHIVHLDKASGAPLSLRNVLGRLLFAFPNALEPSWVIEGLAVLHESDAQHRYGRLENTYFEGQMRAEAARGLRSLREVNAGGRGFPLNRDYLYGSYFFLYLQERYGERAVRSFIDDYSRNIVPFKIDSTAQAVAGKGMDAVWADYQEWLRARFIARQRDWVQGREIRRAYAISAPALGRGGTRWYVETDGYTRPRLIRQAADSPPRAVREVERDSRIIEAEANAVLLSELDICGNHNLLYQLRRADDKGKTQAVTRCGRDRFAASLDDGRIASVRVSEGGAEVVLFAAGGEARTLYRAPPGDSISGLATSGQRIVITRLRASQWALVDISDGGERVLLSDEAVKHSPRFDEATGAIFFVADYERTYDIWSWREGRSSLYRWSRTPYGVREMSAPMGGEILLTTLEADGAVLRLLGVAGAPLQERAPGLPSAGEANAESVPPGEERPYSALETLRPTSWLPLVQIGDGAVAVGALTLGQDALELHQYVLAPMVELTQGELLGQAQYLYDGRHGVMVNRTLTVRASEPGPSRTQIKAYSVREDAQWVSLWRDLRVNRRLYWGLGAALEREDLHDLALGNVRTQDERVVALLAGIDSRRRQPLSEGPSQGQELRLFYETSRGLGGAFDGNVYRADWRGHVSLGTSVLALRWNEARGQTTAEPFELGGSKSDEYILLPVLNERDFALRGYTTGTPELMGHRARVATVEWRTPLRDIDRHLVVPPLGINRISLNLFTDIGAAWEHGAPPDYHRGIGAELMSEPRLGYVFGLQARLGIARGLDQTGSTKIYLRVGRSF
jgi:hypothetical protein